MTSPTVAVVMCTYNGEKYLRQQLDSILAQTYPIQELIVQDDCSTDTTLAILQEYEAKVPFMKVIENTHNLGFNLNFKTACMRATADLIAISDQDDVWMPEKIQKQVQAIGDYNLCFSAHLRGERMETAHIVSSQYAPEALLFAAQVQLASAKIAICLKNSSFGVEKLSFFLGRRFNFLPTFLI